MEKIQTETLSIGDYFILMQDSPQYFTNLQYFNSIVSGELVNYNGDSLNIPFIIDSFSINNDIGIDTIIKEILAI